jgi:NAD(P)-dependent dehydrogenase (short-subunit alcohol dehydrogenase family)
MSNVTFDFHGKNVLVTGAGEGLGWAIASAFGQVGANVFANDLNPDRADKIAAHINQYGPGQAQAWQGDVSNKLLVGPMIEAMRDAFGRIDVVVNAAGVEKRGDLTRLDEWDWRRMMDVNLNGAFFVTQLAARVMAEEGGGVILHLGSIAGHPMPRPHSAAYSASKAGLIALTKAAAQEWGPFGIRVNTLCPGLVADETSDPAPTTIPLGRWGQAQEVAQTALFLCSAAASFITGQALHVDGGESMV